MERKGISNRLQVVYSGGEEKTNLCKSPITLSRKRESMFPVFSRGARDPCSLFLAIPTNYFSARQRNYCMFISHVRNKLFQACVCMHTHSACVSRHVPALKAAAQWGSLSCYPSHSYSSPPISSSTTTLTRRLKF